MTRELGIGYAVAAFALAAAALLCGPYWVDVLNNIGLYALLALSLNVILGDAGLFNMGTLPSTRWGPTRPPSSARDTRSRCSLRSRCAGWPRPSSPPCS